jgi:hypothetical protein
MIRIETLAKKIRRRKLLRRYVLEPDDRRVILDCNDAIRLALQSLGVSPLLRICCITGLIVVQIRVALKVAAQNQDIVEKLTHLEALVTRMVAVCSMLWALFHLIYRNTEIGRKATKFYHLGAVNLSTPKALWSLVSIPLCLYPPLCFNHDVLVINTYIANYLR